MALNAYLRLKIDGSDIDVAPGEDNSAITMGGIDVSTALETMFFKASMDMEGSSGELRASTYPEVKPAEFWVRIGKSTPQLAQAFCQRKRVDLSLEVFHLNHEIGDIELLFKYEIDQGRIVRFELENPSTFEGASASYPALVRLGVIPHIIRWQSVTQRREFEYNWSARS
ncbi:type VI secretion system tube protein Hcp [Hahella ganghwensis]|uniref:type VI secretion system tube protein Hcp n=1 Tax=Hahella ganghwensis TaxID=286420 RepID=UPI0003612BE8|nr:type VI secretion system tube protein Hcp [Hahella ganghwensis]